MLHHLPGVAFITGAGSGIGRECAKKFAKAGCKDLILVDRDGGSLFETALLCDMLHPHGRITTWRILDITDSSAVRERIASIPDVYGSLDYALNIAGIIGKMGFIDNISDQDIDLVINVNLRSAIILNQAEALAMSAPGSQGGVIINVSSVAGLQAQAYLPVYSITKAGIVSLTKSMSSTFASRGIRVNNVAPAATDTPLIAGSFMKETSFAEKYVPMKRLGRPEEIADVIAFLCSEQASYITGETVAVDGGASR